MGGGSNFITLAKSSPPDSAVVKAQNEPRHEISNNVVHVCVTSKALYQPAHMRSLIKAFASQLNFL